MEIRTDMDLNEVQRIMAPLVLECTFTPMKLVQTQQEPLETDSSNDNDNDEGDKALAFEMNFEAQPESPLLRLPGELRNKIYHYLYDDCTVGVAQYQRKVYTVYSCDHSALLQFYVKYKDLGGLCRRFEGADRINTLVIDIRSCVMHGQPYKVELMIKKLGPLCENGKLHRIEIKGDMTPRLYRVTLDLNLDLPDGPDEQRVRVEGDSDWSILRSRYEEDEEGEFEEGEVKEEVDDEKGEEWFTSQAASLSLEDTRNMIERKEEKEQQQRKKKKKKKANVRKIGEICGETHMSATELAGKFELVDKSNPPLLRLSGELRNKIYEYATANCKAEIVVHESNSGQHPRAYTGVEFDVNMNGFGSLYKVNHQLQYQLVAH
ncbi:hypothetical protein G6514_002672 [Epicoccum nigrum]|nr:hypothetical protein G6514_002672 [Epicoccum nigrum]